MHDDRRPAPALDRVPALAELAEFADRAPHLAFGLARRRAMVDALRMAPPLVPPCPVPARS